MKNERATNRTESMRDTTRRAFIKSSGKLAAAAALAGVTLRTSLEAAKWTAVNNYGDSPQNGPTRDERVFDFDWYFKLGDPPGTHNKDFDHSSWRQVNLPHDWGIEGEHSKDNPGGSLGSYLPTGIGWYRKTFAWDPSWEGKLIIIHFDGVYMNSKVWINGNFVGKRPFGYVSFLYDITPNINKGDNVIAVRVDNSLAPSTRWCTPSGIYRHVWLKVMDPTHIPQWGVFIKTPEVSQNRAKLEVETEVVSGDRLPVKLVLETHIVNPSGVTVKKLSSSENIDSAGVFKQSTIVSDPELWSPENPRVYKAISYVKRNGLIVDSLTSPFGIRKLEFNPDSGFFLNGVRTVIKGVSNHEDGGSGVGNAIPEDTRYRQMKILKEMGCNAIRAGYHPWASEFYTMCDTVGFLVLADAYDGWRYNKVRYDYGLYFAEWWKQDLTDFVRRLRNHPSVFMYCLGNEVRGYASPEEAIADRKMLNRLVKTLDNTRPTTQAGEPFPGADDPDNLLDVMGFNGPGDVKGKLEAFHKKHPGVPILGSEMPHTFQTRGVYRTKTRYMLRDNPVYANNPSYAGKWEEESKNIYSIPDLTPEEVFPEADWRYGSSYDNDTDKIGVRDEWKRVKTMPYLMGHFRWSGFDYHGNSGRKRGWPARSDTYGIIDMCGFPKDHYYLHQSFWSSRPMVHILPHWTHPGKEGKIIPVVAYTNGKSAELFFNGISQGKKDMADDLQIVWNVPYQPGTLAVNAYEGDRIVASKTVKTAGAPEQIMISSDRKVMAANQRDVAHLEVDILDREGILVPYACDTVWFSIDGPARLLGVENGDILDTSPHYVPYRKAFNGKCLLVIRATDKTGTVRVIASGKGLRPGEVNITLMN